MDTVNTRSTSVGFIGTRLKAIINKLRDYRASYFLDEELPVSGLLRSWREEGDIIYFCLTSDGMTDKEWVKYLEGKGCYYDKDYIKQVLNSSDFRTTNGVTTEFAVLKGVHFGNNDRITEKIRVEADKYKFRKLNIEEACLLQRITMKELEVMGLWRIVAMTEPINDSKGIPRLLRVGCGDKGRKFERYRDRSNRRWSRGGGFAFAVSSTFS